MENQIQKFKDKFYKLPNSYEHLYRVFQKKWGIYIQIFAEYRPYSSYHDKKSCTEICSGLWAVYSNHISGSIAFTLNKNEMNYLWDGLKKTCAFIKSHSPYDLDTLIIIHYIWFNDCHYQEEGLTAAIIEWAAHAFDFETPHMNVRYDMKLDRYQFIYQ